MYDMRSLRSHPDKIFSLRCIRTGKRQSRMQLGFSTRMTWIFRKPPSASERDNARQEGYGGACRDRTDDPLLAKQVLSQLS